MPTVKVQADSKKPMTMEELLNSPEYAIHVPKKGDVVEGKVTQVTRRMVVVDVGGKTEGIVVDKEFDLARDYVDKLKVGDTISCYILDAENDKGQILLSLKRAAMDQRWTDFSKKMETGDVVNVHGLELNKGGMVAVLDGIRGFVPTSQFSKQHMNNLEALLNMNFDV